MGKAKKATRKELKKVIGEIIHELQNMQTAFTALDNYVGLYVEWKGDKVKFPEYLQKRFSKPEESVKVLNVEGSKKSEKKDRYKKISEPL